MLIIYLIIPSTLHLYIHFLLNNIGTHLLFFFYFYHFKKNHLIKIEIFINKRRSFINILIFIKKKINKLFKNQSNLY